MSKRNDTLLVLDARERREYDVSHLKNAVYVGYTQLNPDIINNTDRLQPIIAYCSVGYRSEKVAEKILERGFTNMKNLYGGIFEWKNQDKAVANDHGITSNGHAYNKMRGFWLKKEKIY